MPKISLLLSSQEWIDKFTHNVDPPIVTVEDLFERDSMDLIRSLKCTLEDIDKLKMEVSVNILKESHSISLAEQQTYSWKAFPPAIPVMANLATQSSVFRPSGFPELDEMLAGGYPAGQTILFLGESQTGKTQVLMTSLVAAAMRGYCSIFINTCNHFSLKRLATIAQRLLAQELAQNPHMVHPNLDHQKRRLTEILSKISIYNCFTIWSLVDLFSKLHNLDYGFDIIALDCLHHVVAGLVEDVPTQSRGSKAPEITLLPTLAQLGIIWRAINLKHKSTILVTNVVSPESNRPSQGQSSILELQTGGILPFVGVYDTTIKLSTSTLPSTERILSVVAESIFRPPYWKHLPIKASLMLS